jgi:hypothetical protein
MVGVTKGSLVVLASQNKSFMTLSGTMDEVEKD